jgi:hypothetical protein
MIAEMLVQEAVPPGDYIQIVLDSTEWYRIWKCPTPSWGKGILYRYKTELFIMKGNDEYT